MKRLFAFALLLGLPAAFAACDMVVDDCGPFDNTFEITGFQTEALETEVSGDSLSTHLRLTPIEGDTVAYDRFAIRMLAQIDTYSADAESSPSFSLVRRAYACSPPPLASEETIRDIQIYSDQDFDAAHPAGTDLAGLFDVFVFYQRNGYERADLNAFVAGAPNAAEELVLVLKAAPQAAGAFRFTVKYFQEGRALDYYEFETESVTIGFGL